MSTVHCKSTLHSVSSVQFKVYSVQGKKYTVDFTTSVHYVLFVFCWLYSEPLYSWLVTLPFCVLPDLQTIFYLSDFLYNGHGAIKHLFLSNLGD